MSENSEWRFKNMGYAEAISFCEHMRDAMLRGNREPENAAAFERIAELLGDQSDDRVLH